MAIPKALDCRPRPGHVRSALALVAFIAGTLGACQHRSTDAQHQQAPPITVQAVTLVPVQLPRTLFAVGSVRSPESTELAAELAGKLVLLDIPEGQEVEAGHLLARLDYADEEAAVTIAEAHAANARATLARLKKLPTRATSEQALDDARANVRATSGQLEEARETLRKTSITAPFAGKLGLKLVSLGAYLDPGTPIVRLTQIHPLHFVFSLPQRYLPLLRLGQTLHGVVGDCQDVFSARVSAIDPFLDENTRSVQIQAVVPNPDGRLLPGMAATVHLEVASIPNALLIPHDAVLRQGARRSVYVVNTDGSVSNKVVTLGEFTVQQVQVTSGLEPGERVIAAGHQKLRPGARVTVQPYAPVENPNLALGLDGAPAACEF